MTDETPFFCAINSHPLDYGPIGVYADWLDERGDAGGEALRWAVRLGRRPDWQGECLWLSGDYRVDLFNYSRRCEISRELHIEVAGGSEIWWRGQWTTVLAYTTPSAAWLALAAGWKNAQPHLRKRWLNLKPKLNLEPTPITPE